MPAGNYTALSIELDPPNLSRGWTLKSVGKTGKLKNFQIHSGRDVSFDVGPPLEVKTNTSGNKERVLIGFNLTGRAGEMYAAHPRKNRKKPLGPPIKIIAESGKVLVADRFKYG